MPTEARRISVSEIQQRLAEKATAQPAHRFGGLYDLLTWETILDAAATRLLGNKGSRTPGLDGIDRRALREHRAYHLAHLRQQLLDDTYQPSPVRRVYIPKANGKQRPLGIPTLYDRWIQMAIKLILEPIFESDFASFSHGFRPQRSCHTAIAHIHKLTLMRKRRVYWVIEGDIEGCFDHVQHQKLMTLLRQRIQDKQLLALIWRFLRAGVMEGQLFTKTAEGTPQGGVLSPLLANIYLNHFDQWFARRAKLGDGYGRDRERKAGHANFQMVRYADDFVVFSNGSREETAAFKAEMAAWFADELKLTLSPEKTAITHYTDGFDFLGFTLKKKIAPKSHKEVVVIYPSTASVQRAVRRIKDLTARETLYNSPEDQIEALNAFLRGWGEYFRRTSASDALSYVGSRAFMRMWQWLQAKSGRKHGWRAIKAAYYRENTWQVGRHQLVKLGSFKVEYPICRAIPNPYLRGEPVYENPVSIPFPGRWQGNHSYGGDWQPLREAVRETTEGRCIICGTDVDVQIHHIKAKKKGGRNVADNLVPLCRTHHRAAEQRNNPVSHRLHESTRDS